MFLKNLISFSAILVSTIVSVASVDKITPNLDAGNNFTEEVSLHSTKSATVLNALNKTAKLSNVSHTKRENKIADIFKRVAYGGTNLQFDGKNNFSEFVTPQAFAEIDDVSNKKSLNAPLQMTEGDASFSTDKKNVVGSLKTVAVSNRSKHRQMKFLEDKLSPDSHVSLMEFDYVDDSITIAEEENLLSKAIVNQLGKFWTAHVYLFVSLFAANFLLTLVCLVFSMSLQSKLTAWRCNLLHTLILVAGACRCIQMIIDPYGISHVAPVAVAAVVHDLVFPLLTLIMAWSLSLLLHHTGIYLLLLNQWILLGTSVLLLFGLVAVDLAKSLTEFVDLMRVLHFIILALVAFWGSMLCLGLVMLLIKVHPMGSKRRGGREAVNHCESFIPQLLMATRLAVVGGLSQLLLSGLIVYSLVGPKEPPGTSKLLTWAWWLQNSLARLFEVIALTCITISSSFVSMQKNSFNNIPFLLRICFSNEKTRKSSKNFSTTQRPPLTMMPALNNPKDSADYVTSDFKLVWTTERNYNLNDKYLTITDPLYQSWAETYGAQQHSSLTQNSSVDLDIHNNKNRVTTGVYKVFPT